MQDFKIYFHVGPGKTGSSALQKWLLDNRQLLLSKSVYYPLHSLDENGVSSGNVDSIFKRNQNGDLIFDQSKKEIVLKDFGESGCDTLLFSSEAFYNNIEVLYAEFPTANFIYYLRNPLEVMDSTYNQSVKRHYNSNKIYVPIKAVFPQVKKLLSLIRKIPIKHFIFRFYGSKFFEGGDIVTDFLSVLNINQSKSQLSEKINLSYSLQALEFKRLINRIPNKKINRKLDLFLQNYQKGNMNYSLINERVLANYKKSAVLSYKEFFSAVKLDGDDFIESISEYKGKPYFEQLLSYQEVLDILNELKLRSLTSSFHLILLVKKFSELFLDSPDFLKAVNHFEKSFSYWVRVILKYKLDKEEKLLANEDINLSKDSIRLFSKSLKLNKQIEDADVLRELALLAERNGDILLAYKVMMQAKKERPSGTIINEKILFYAEQLQNKSKRSTKK